MFEKILPSWAQDVANVAKISGKDRDCIEWSVEVYVQGMQNKHNIMRPRNLQAGEIYPSNTEPRELLLPESRLEDKMQRRKYKVVIP